MNLGLWFNDQIGQLSQAVQDELQQLVAAIQTGWNVEHDGNGHHTAITGTSLALTGPAQTTMYSIAPSSFATIDATVAGMVLAPSIRAAYIRVIMSGGSIRVDGIDATRYQIGDVVLLTNASDEGGGAGSNLTLRLQSTTANQEYRFRGNPATPDTDIILPPGRFVVSIRDFDRLTLHQYWRVSHF
jgi:hypothetical protein